MKTPEPLVSVEYGPLTFPSGTHSIYVDVKNVGAFPVDIRVQLNFKLEKHPELIDRLAKRALGGVTPTTRINTLRLGFHSADEIPIEPEATKQFVLPPNGMDELESAVDELPTTAYELIILQDQLPVETLATGEELAELVRRIRTHLE